ncbi:MAG: sigma-54-dependent transcriptional regulator [bacterium]
MRDLASIMIVDDEGSVRITLRILLERNGHRVLEASSGAEAISILKGGEIPDLVITDLKMEDLDGLGVLKAVKDEDPSVEILVVTAYGSIESAVDAVKMGAFDYITKPFEPDRILIAIEKALERRSLINEVRSLREQVRGKYGFENIIGRSQPMQRVLELVSTVSKTDATVVIEGESGTGKELIARAIHNNSPRVGKPFVGINCGALPETLLESELFGHVKGAFTGATSNRKGLFEEADGGTFFLDEIGDMSPSTQVKLLRVLQEGEVRRIGSNLPTKVDVRILAATNRKLTDLVEEGKLREDLFYRLSVIVISIPPLRERKEDIVPLAEHFLEVYRKKIKKPVSSFSLEAMNALLNHSWPGNVRELENTIERAVILTSSSVILPENLLIPTSPLDHNGESAVNLEDVEREYILKTLRECSWNKAKAAQRLKIGRSTLWRKLKKYNIPT